MKSLRVFPSPISLSSLRSSTAIMALGLCLTPVACGSSSDSDSGGDGDSSAAGDGDSGMTGDGDSGAAGDSDSGMTGDGDSGAAGDGDEGGAELVASPGPAGLTGYCTATFTAETDLSLDWGVGFTAQAGDTFLVVGGESTTLSGDVVGFAQDLVLETDRGLLEVRVDYETAPFELSCSTVSSFEGGVLVVWEETTLYTDETFSTELCTLSSGASAPAGSFNGLTNSQFIDHTEKTAVVGIDLGGFAAECGADEGFISVPTHTLNGVDAVPLPFAVVHQQD